ncbi:MAG: mechanosensitive ion channel [Acidobacteria bacterium]|nr:mechanosensitive ion channel [Acidobacteriota bacterium]
MKDAEVTSLLIRAGITLGVVVGLYLIAFLLKILINRKVDDIFQRHAYRKLIYYIIGFASVIFIAIYWVKNVTALGAILGGLGAALVVALHKPAIKIYAWIIILTKKLYKIGDRIQIGNLIGDVIDITIYYTILLEVGNWFKDEQSTGRIVYAPNDQVFNENVYNYTKGFKYVWHEIPIVVTFESDWQKAKEILTEILRSKELKVDEPAREEIRKLTDKHVIQYKNLTPIVWTKIIDFGVELNMRYLTDTRKMRSSENFIAQKVLLEFARHPEIDFAYPTYRIHQIGEEIPEHFKKK